MNDKWILVSPHRAKRPWLGQVEKLPEVEIKPHDIKNPLCPGATRASGEVSCQYNYFYWTFNVYDFLKVILKYIDHIILISEYNLPFKIFWYSLAPDLTAVVVVILCFMSTSRAGKSQRRERWLPQFLGTRKGQK